jgi:ribose transport system permease protein
MTTRKKRVGLGGQGERFALVVVWIGVIAIFSLLSPHGFFTARNFSTMFGSQAVLVVLTLGLLIPLTAGDYDLSLAGVLSLSAMMIAVLNVRYGVPLVWAVLAALGMGVVVGLVNGAISVLFEIDPFIVTLGTGSILVGLVYWFSNSMTISGISSFLTSWVVVRRLFGIPLEFYYGLVLCACLWYFFGYTALGRRLLFVGRGRNVARLSGIRVDRVRVGCLVASAFIAALAGVLYAGTMGAADPTSGSSYLLPAYAAAFLGATCIVPGFFNPWGAFVAVYFLVTGITGLSILGVQTFVQNLFYGGALVVALAVSQTVKKGQERRARLE